MMPEIAMNVLDIAENSVKAQASLVEITVEVDQMADTLTITIADNGCGMSEEQVAQVEDPFFTTRTTRKIGLGVPFFKLAALSTGGDFKITSQLNVGTTTMAQFKLSHIDRMPLGDINGTIHTLITFNTHMDFVYTYRFNGQEFTLDTREFKQILDGVPLNVPEVSQYIAAFLEENKLETDGGAII